ncbi:DUF1993 domain-containing protein [Aquabacterium sp. A7-Y]|uniref:DUF1993 domain-containing protein n=1 Tax=Aquabacterium sp. A7-Y TaxID=1349605 RepID=UPI00223DB5E0|nr:DUF1993 domain-containing protein [Aquabacterium sp. A7-Y]MCW7537829.1 DUF1993 domain-containing protein [Aquabacterium sp. A7-Y]
MTLYDLSMPALTQALQNLAHLLEKAAGIAHAQGLAPAALLQRRLAPDMFPLALQVDILVSGTRGAAARLCGRLAPRDDSREHAVFNRGSEAEFDPPAASFTELQASVEQALSELKALSPADVETAPDSLVSVAKPGNVRVFEARTFVLGYVLPNLYFHLTLVYALLRSAGIPLGKQDFEGSPAYRVVPDDLSG